MAGKPAALAGYGGEDGAADCSRIVTVAHRLATYVCAHPRINVHEFCQLSFLLARYFCVFSRILFLPNACDVHVLICKCEFLCANRNPVFVKEIGISVCDNLYC